MLTVSYQVIYNQEPNFEELIDILKNSFEEYIEVDDEIAVNILDFHYSKQLNDQNKYIVGFELSFDEIQGIDEFFEDIISSFNDQLKKHDVDAVFKYYDGILFNTLMECYHNIFKIEMKLREIITFIFVDTYKDDFYNLLSEIDVNPKYPKKREISIGNTFKGNIKNNFRKREEYLSIFLENEFFYFLFDEYKKVVTPKNLQNNDLIEITKYADDFEDFQSKLVNRGVTDPEYKKTLEEIKIFVENFGDVRNCIAHNRTPSASEINNLHHYLTKLDEKIEEFIENIEDTYSPF